MSSELTKGSCSDIPLSHVDTDRTLVKITDESSQNSQIERTRTQDCAYTVEAEVRETCDFDGPMDTDKKALFQKICTDAEDIFNKCFELKAGKIFRKGSGDPVEYKYRDPYVR